MSDTNENLELDVSTETPINNLSLINLRKPIQYEGNYCFRFLKISSVPESSGDVQFRIQSIINKRPDVLSYTFYGTPYLKDFILLANNIIDPFQEFEIGSIIRIPDLLTIYDILKNLREIFK